jgi:hypothetical protein
MTLTISKDDMQIIALADESCMQFFIEQYVGESAVNEAELLADLSRTIIGVVNDMHMTAANSATEQKVTLSMVCKSAGIDALTYHTLYLMSERAAKNVSIMLEKGMLTQAQLANLPKCGATKDAIVKTIGECVTKLQGKSV